jgi:hypothetical protein
MSLTHKRLIKTQIPQVAGALGVVVPPDTVWFLKEITLKNTSASVVDVTLYLGVTATGPNEIFTYSLDAGEYYPIPLEYPWVAEAGEALFGEATTNNVVNIVVCGAEADA